MESSTNIHSHPVGYVNGERKTRQSSNASVVNEKTFSSESSYARQRRNLLDILSRLHSTGCVLRSYLPPCAHTDQCSAGYRSPSDRRNWLAKRRQIIIN